MAVVPLPHPDSTVLTGPGGRGLLQPIRLDLGCASGCCWEVTVLGNGSSVAGAVVWLGSRPGAVAVMLLRCGSDYGVDVSVVWTQLWEWLWR